MKRTLLLVLTLAATSKLHAQKIEWSVQANTSLFHFSGKSSTSTSAINQGSANDQNYTNNPYGSKNGWGYGFNLGGQHVAKSGFIFGIQAGYELLKSEVDINEVHLYYYPNPYIYTIAAINPTIKANGQTSLQNYFININPYVGYRWHLGKVDLDVLPGFDIGFGIKSYDKGKATAEDGTLYTTDKKRNDPPTDIRLRLGIAASYKRFAITGGYAYGLKNYLNGVIGDANSSAHSQLIRLGLLYKIK
jgi:hypothetical protein